MEILIESVENREIEFVAIEIGTNGNILASGQDAEKVVEEANKTEKEYIISYIPSNNHMFIF